MPSFLLSPEMWSPAVDVGTLQEWRASLLDRLPLGGSPLLLSTGAMIAPARKQAGGHSRAQRRALRPHMIGPKPLSQMCSPGLP
jgi:hypothetical protein